MSSMILQPNFYNIAAITYTRGQSSSFVFGWLFIYRGVDYCGITTNADDDSLLWITVRYCDITEIVGDDHLSTAITKNENR